MKFYRYHEGDVQELIDLLEKEKLDHLVRMVDFITRRDMIICELSLKINYVLEGIAYGVDAQKRAFLEALENLKKLEKYRDYYERYKQDIEIQEEVR